MNKEKVLRWLYPNEKEYEWTIGRINDLDDNFFIAAISTRFAELGKGGMDCSLKRWSNTDWTIREYVFDHELEEIVDSTIGHGPTPFEAWMNAALAQCKEVK